MLTVVVPTFNNEASICQVLESAQQVADAIIVIDSFSRDNTVGIAKDHGASIFQRDYRYSADQKNWILDRVDTEWVMILDSDELLSNELVTEINELRKQGFPQGVIGYRMVFVQFLWGKQIPGIMDAKVKLFRTRVFRFEDILVHAHPVSHEGGIVKTLRNPVYHFGIKSIEHWFDKMNIYTTWDSIERKKRKPVYKWEVVVKPPLLFLRQLLKEKAVVYGFRGFIWAAMTSVIFLLILLKHYELTHHADQNFMRIDS